MTRKIEGQQSVSEKQAVSDNVKFAINMSVNDVQSAVSKQISQHVFFYNRFHEPLGSYGPQTTAWAVVGRCYNYGD